MTPNASSTFLICRDGRRLDLLAVPVLDRNGEAYEAQLHLRLSGEAFGVIGERCHGVLAAAAARGLVGSQQDALRRAGLRLDQLPHLPRDLELFSLRSRDPDDLPGRGALRALLDVRHTYARGWQHRAVVLLEAWGNDGTGVRAELEPADYLALLVATLAACEQASPVQG